MMTQAEIDVLTEADVADELYEAPDDARLLARATTFASKMTDADMLAVDLFSDDCESRVLESRIVRGRKAHVDHYSRRPIAAGERHRMQREVCEGQFLVTRHSELTMFMTHHGFDPPEAEAA